MKQIALAATLGFSGLLVGCQNLAHPGTVVTTRPPSSVIDPGPGNTKPATNCDDPFQWGSAFAADTSSPSGGFVATGSLVIPRAAHTATLLPDGTVLVVGGGQLDIDDLLVSIASAEVFDPTQGKFAATGRPCVARELHTATLLANGKVLIVGGNEFSGYPTWLTSIPNAELYDPATRTFTTTGSMSIGRTLHTATLLRDGRVLIVGGNTDFSGPTTTLPSNTEIYDPSRGTFSTAANLITPRAAHTATMLQNGKVLITGGENAQGALSSAELYDPAANSFSATGTMTAPRTGHTATLLVDGRVLITGGASSSAFPRGAISNGNIQSTAELYDPATGQFSPVSNMHAPRIAHSSTLLPDGRVLITGGFEVWSSDLVPSAGLEYVGYVSLNSAELYDPKSETFTSIGAMGTPRLWHTATSLSDGSVLIVGGIGNDSPKASAEIYK